MARLYLASASPRRHELLRHLGVDFVVTVSRFDESTLSHLTDGAELVRQAAQSKAAEVASRCAGIVLGVDTDVVAPDGRILGKPADADDARRMLRSLAGATHTVYSGVAVIESEPGGRIVRAESRVVATRVTMAALTERIIDAYIATGEPFDKAGGYGIQGGAMPFVVRIDGDPSNVIGLPLWSVGEILTGFGVSLWNFDPLTPSNTTP